MNVTLFLLYLVNLQTKGTKINQIYKHITHVCMYTWQNSISFCVFFDLGMFLYLWQTKQTVRLWAPVAICLVPSFLMIVNSLTNMTYSMCEDLDLIRINFPKSNFPSKLIIFICCLVMGEFLIWWKWERNREFGSILIGRFRFNSVSRFWKIQFYGFWSHKQIRWFVISVFYVNVCIETNVSHFSLSICILTNRCLCCIRVFYCPVLELKLNG